MACLALSPDRVYKLYNSHPAWRLYIILRLLTVVFAALTMASVGVITIKYQQAWPWPSVYFGWSFFVPGILSIVWCVVALSILLYTTRRIAPAADIGVDFFVFVLDMVAFAYSVCKKGPMQSWIQGNGGNEAGAWEMIAVLSLGLHGLLHLVLAYWASRGIHFGRPMDAESAKPSKTPTWVREKSSPTTSSSGEEPGELSTVSWSKRTRSSRDELRDSRTISRSMKYSSPTRPPNAQVKEVFELPAEGPRSHQHVRRYGNSWDMSCRSNA